MLAIERKYQVVVECRTLPTARRCAVTGLAIRGESGLLVVGIRRPLIIRKVTARTGRRRTRVLSVRMTKRTVGDSMLTIERKYQVVIERRALPTAR